MKYAIELLVTGVLEIIDVAETFEKAVAIGLHMRRQNEHHFPSLL